MKYPVGIQTFEQIRKAGYAYVDKTALVHRLVTTGKLYFLSRPRRFGKSLLVSTLEAYFRGRKDLFAGLAMEELEAEWTEHVVLHLDLGGINYVEPGALEAKLQKRVSEWELQFGLTPATDSIPLRFSDVIREAQKAYGRGVVVLIDEYDKPLLDVLGLKMTVRVGGMDMTLEERNRGILKGFYSVLKEQDRNLRFVLLTGVTKFSQVSVFSGLNNLADISMTRHYETLCGITQEELETTLSDGVDELTEMNEWTRAETLERLKSRYDGYHFSRRMTDVYNPYSLISAMQSGDVEDHWFKTGTPTYLIRLLRGSGTGLDEMAGRFYAAEAFEDYRADTERPLPMIFQSGYLTIKAYDARSERYLLDLPNDEVRRGFLRLIADSELSPEANAGGTATGLALALEDGKLDTFMTTMTAFLASIPYTMRRKDTERERERYFQYTFYLVLKIMGTYSVDVEVAQSQGRVDCVVKTRTDVYVLEFKLDGSADDALRQIDAQGYVRPYEGGALAVHKVGVSFSSATGTIGEWREA